MTTFKYLPPERVSFLEDGLIRYTPPGGLNDPFECIPVVSIEETHQVVHAIIAEKQAALRRGYATRRQREEFRAEKAAMLGKLAANPSVLRDFFFDRARETLNAKIGILSLSKRWDSSLMWSHYCLAHTGLCVGFDRAHPFFHGVGRTPDSAIRDVRYSDMRVRVPIERGVNIDFDVMFTKSLDWQYEQEERMLGMLAAADQVIYRSPFPIHLFRVPLDTVTEVTVGARATRDLETVVSSWCSDRGIPAYRAIPSSESFDMLRESLAA